ncbi:hypothetical protein APUTEX25_004692, partial [Auxenochlorella protothecoides]
HRASSTLPGAAPLSACASSFRRSAVKGEHGDVHLHCRGADVHAGARGQLLESAESVAIGAVHGHDLGVQDEGEGVHVYGFLHQLADLLHRVAAHGGAEQVQAGADVEGGSGGRGRGVQPHARQPRRALDVHQHRARQGGDDRAPAGANAQALHQRAHDVAHLALTAGAQQAQHGVLAPAACPRTAVGGHVVQRTEDAGHSERVGAAQHGLRRAAGLRHVAKRPGHRRELAGGQGLGQRPPRLHVLDQVQGLHELMRFSASLGSPLRMKTPKQSTPCTTPLRLASSCAKAVEKAATCSGANGTKPAPAAAPGDCARAGGGARAGEPTPAPVAAGTEMPEEELSEEDLALKEKLEQWVEQIKTGDSDAQCSAVEGMSVEIRSATSTMTSVPAPLKFLAPHYAPLEATHAALPAGHPAAAPLSDVLSALAMTSAPGGSRACLRYKLTGAAGADVAVWGHEYVRHLSGEIGEEVGARRAAGEAVDDLLALVDLIVPYDMSHNAEPDAIDLLLEVDRVADLPRHVDAGNAERAARYLQACAAYLPEPEDEAALRAVHAVHMRVGRHAGALRVGLALGDAELVGAAWRAAADGGERCQLAYIMGRAGFVPDLEEGSLAVADEALRERYFSCYSNSRLPELYAALGRDLDVMEPKLPEDVYKMHLVEGRVPTGPAVDSARANLSATFVNGLVNAGFGKDKLVTPGVEDDAVHWVFKNKDHGKLSAAASLGLVMLWDLEGGLPAIDRF